ncbi:MAG: HTH domain-containing protein [Candidatus Pacearchaeota archaeon]
MAEKRVKNIVISLSLEPRFRVFSRKGWINIEGIKKLRNIFSEERAKILFTLKQERPESIYQLAKKLGRDVKAVKKDLKILEQIGVITLTQEKKKARIKIKPQIAVDEINVKFVI